MSQSAVFAALIAASAGLAVAKGPVSHEISDEASRNGKFTVVGMPDTQNYSEFYPEIYRAQTEWIVRNRAARNIRFVSHYGDVVNHGDRDNEWRNSKDAMRTLEEANIPHGVTAGNHDITPSGSAGSPYIPQKYLEYYGAQNYQGRAWYGGASPSGMSNYQVFTGGGREFIAFHLMCDTPVAELVWAQGVINNNRDKAVMMTTHRYLQDAEDYTSGVPIVPSGRYPDSWYTFEGTYAPGGIHSEELWKSFVRTNRNIFMVNCGHFHEEYRQTSTNLFGAPVQEVLADYQDDPNGGNGYLRLMEFDVPAGRVDVKSYSPTLNNFLTKAESQFSLSIEFDRYRDTGGVKTVAFQQGINGYTGTQDTWINENAKSTSYGNDQTFDVDDDTTNSPFSDRRGQGLVRFDGVVTQDGANNTIPRGATITEASLRLVLEDDIDNPFSNPRFNVYMLTRDWNEASTWNSLANGLSQGEDYGMFLGSFLGDNSPNDDWWRSINVLGAVQAWANGAPNYGFAILPEIISGNDDGITVWSSEAANFLYRPTLEVRYTMNLPAPGAAVGGFAMCFGLTRRRRG